MSFYDPKLRKNTMALLSKVTVVVKPSPQLETPAPMTGDPLEVFEQEEFLDPPSILNGNAAVFLNIINPQPYLPYPESNDNSPPPTIFRSFNYHIREERSNRRVPRVIAPPSMCDESDVILYQGSDGVVGMTMPTGGAAATVVPNVINGRDDYINDFLTYDVNNGTTWYLNANGDLENQLNSENLGIGIDKVSHAWVMCGIGYVITTNGEIRKSLDGFAGDIVDFSSIGYRPDESFNYAIMRNHPGILLASNVPYTD